ncbi:fatty acid synthase alpha subunit Lsd1 [Linderina macrospora]|uniref:Fatty acid synthase alpha subunit Lsd1 n=1 Tax=Linderina macrospora TaxID=4868 RepID=A0ACC1JC53_9FUNG|nr:fatty acid synthase alpha subunit Lsd1 [Linderina macrospora]
MDQQLKRLGRTPGYAVPACMETGIIPGNRNLDNVTSELEAYDHIVFPSKSIQTPGIDAALVTSFGFGQVGGEILVLNPDYVYAVLSKGTLGQHRLKVKEGEQKSNRYWQDMLVGNHPFAQLKDAPPFTPEEESRVYMDPTARVKYDLVSKKYHF